MPDISYDVKVMNFSETAKLFRTFLFLFLLFPGLQKEGKGQIFCNNTTFTPERRKKLTFIFYFTHVWHVFCKSETRQRLLSLIVTALRQARGRFINILSNYQIKTMSYEKRLRMERKTNKKGKKGPLKFPS